MKNVFALATFLLFAGSLAAQNVADQSIASGGFSFSNHLKTFSWLYIGLFVLLVGFFIAGYLFGWDKKLFKHKTGEDNHMFI